MCRLTTNKLRVRHPVVTVPRIVFQHLESFTRNCRGHAKHHLPLFDRQLAHVAVCALTKKYGVFAVKLILLVWIQLLAVDVRVKF